MITAEQRIENAIDHLKVAIKSAVDREEYEAADDMNNIMVNLDKPNAPSFSDQQIQQLQNKVYEITGPGEIMGLFNELLGVCAG